MSSTRPRTSRIRSVTLTDSRLTSLAAQDSFVQAFPPLRLLKGSQVVKSSGCSSCSQSKNAAERAAAFSRVKMSLNGMSDPQKRKLAEMLNTEEIRMTYMSAGKRKNVVISAPARES